MSKLLEEPMSITSTPEDIRAEIAPTIFDGFPRVALPPLISFSDEDFLELCRLNQDLQFEQSANGEIIIMPPTGGITGNRNLRLIGQVYVWIEQSKNGIGFDSSTLFRLPNGAIRSPDVAWISTDRWQQLTADEREGIVPLCPDFVIELRSPTDSLKQLQAKMREYIANGAQLGLLIDAKAKQVHVYRPQQAVATLDNPPEVSCEPLLSSFTLNLSAIW